MTKHVLIALITCALFSCTNNRRGSHVTTSKQDTFAPPKITILADLPDSLQPKTVLLDTMPKPRIVTVPTRSGGFYTATNSKGETTKIPLEPPAAKALPVLLDERGKPVKDSAGNTFVMGVGGGLSNFTTFNTDNGLVLDGVICSKIDRMGNLWFGTTGGGVSRYDGKSFVSFSTAQGLANNVINSIAEDKHGNLWFGTDGGGVSRYDGKSFINFSTNQGLANNSVMTIVEDRSGNLWFGTMGGGLSRYDVNRANCACNANKCQHNLDVPKQQEQHNKKIAESFTTFDTKLGLSNNSVWNSLRDKAGNLWFGTDGGVSRFDGKTFTTFSTAQGLANNCVVAIAQDKTGTIWFGTRGGVSYCNPTANSGKDSKLTFSSLQALSKNFVMAISEDKTGNLWFGIWGGGVRILGPASNNRKGERSLSCFSKAQGLADDNVCTIVEDNAGHVWFGTLGGGVSRYGGSAFVSFSIAQGLPDNSVLTIAEEKTARPGQAAMWFGTHGAGASRYDGKSVVTFSTAQGLANNQVFCITQDRTGSLWLGTAGGGVSRYDPAEKSGNGSKSFTTFSTAQGLANNQVCCIAQDKAGNMWFGTLGGGVSRFDPAEKSGTGSKSFTSFSTAQGLANDEIICIYEDKIGNLWFGTFGGGVSCFNGKSFVTFTTAQGMAGNSVTNIAEDKAGNLWFATTEGLSVMSKEDAANMTLYAGDDSHTRQHNMAGAKRQRSIGIFKTFTKADGLPDKFVSQVLQMPNGKIAVGTNLGIAICSPSSDLTRLEDIAVFNSNTDYPVKAVNVGQNCLYVDNKGILWAGTGSNKTALVRFDYNAVNHSKEPPKLVIQSVKINETSVCWNDLSGTPNDAQSTKAGDHPQPAYFTEEVTTFGRPLTEKERDSMRRLFGGIHFDSIRQFYPVPEGLILPYRHNHVTLDFNAIETSRPKLVHYQYKMEGYDQDWSPVSKNTAATYGNIQEGSYTFKVKAQSPDGIWCTPITYTFTVLPPWYRTWWAYTTYALLLLLALRIFTKWRELKLMSDKAKLERIVEERTTVVEQQKDELLRKNITVEQEKQRSEELLLNILPEEIASELKVNGTSAAKQFDNVTVLFTDFVGFSTASERMTPQELVNELHACFQAFDGIMGKYNIEKIKTVGDAYLAVCGLPLPSADHAENVIKAALEIRDFMVNRYATLGSKTFQIRIGVHSGSLVAGIVGVKKFAYDVWGDTVNTAARMEQNSEAGKINISQATYELVKDQFSCTYRGEIAAKNKGMLRMYFVG